MATRARGYTPAAMWYRNQPVSPSPRDSAVMWCTSMHSAINAPLHAAAFQLPILRDLSSRSRDARPRGSASTDVNQPQRKIALRTG